MKGTFCGGVWGELSLGNQASSRKASRLAQ